jgi:hypothetical protein
MRSILNKFSVVLIIFGYCAFAHAQDANISVGAITRYSGIATSQGDIKDLKDVNQFLNVLESQVAREFVNHVDVDYLDRMNTDEVFRELHLSSNTAFNPSSGALRGLMGRLDFLVVIDSSEPTTARIRLIDVESGAVKALEVCKRKTTLFGLAQDSPADCVVPFVARTTGAARMKRLAKAARLQQHAAQDRAAKQKMASEQIARETDQLKEKRAAQAQAKAEAAARAEEIENVKKQEEAESKAAAELNTQIEALKPELDDLSARLSSTNDLWGSMARQLASSGLQLRSDVQSALNVANADSRRCRNLVSLRNLDQLQSCISKLRRDLEKLDALK